MSVMRADRPESSNSILPSKFCHIRMCPYPFKILCVSDILYNILRTWHCHCISHILPHTKSPQNIVA